MRQSCTVSVKTLKRFQSDCCAKFALEETHCSAGVEGQFLSMLSFIHVGMCSNSWLTITKILQSLIKSKSNELKIKSLQCT